jgi:hypothetical protein
MSEPNIVLNQLNIIAANFESTIEFYRRLGLAIPSTAVAPEGIQHGSWPPAESHAL